MSDVLREIAFVGLGSMGLPMAKNLVKAGFGVRGFDLKESAITELESVGGRGARSARQACEGADAIVLMVVNSAQASNILLDDGSLDVLAAGGVVVLAATCPPSDVRQLADRVEASGRHFVDAPVSGGVVGASAGSLTIMVGALSESFTRVRPLLNALGRKIIHIGEMPGQGAMAKAVNQLLCGVHLAAAAEAMSLCERLGIDSRTMLDLVSDSAASSWMLRDRGSRMLERDPVVTSTVNIFVKDLGIVLRSGADAGAALPLSAMAHQMFLAAAGAGNGQADDSQVIRTYKALNPRKD